MTALKDLVVTETLDLVKVVYLDREVSKSWNAKRKADDTATFCGFYWVRGMDENGPFRSRSSAIRDAYYRFVLKREVPTVGQTALPGYKRPKVTATRRTKPARAREALHA